MANGFNNSAPNNQAGGYKKPNVNSSGISFFGTNDMMLRLGMLDDTVALTLCPAQVNEEGKRSYPQNMRESLIITPNRAMALYRILTEDVLSAIESGGNVNKGIFYTNDKRSILSWVVSNGNDVSLAFFKDIDGDRVAQKSFAFTFGKLPIIDGYVSGGNDFKITEVHADVYLFSTVLQGIIAGEVGAGHSAKKETHWVHGRILNAVEAIATATGATVPTNTYGSQRAGGGTNSSAFDNMTSTAMPPITEVSSLDSIMNLS